MTTTADTLMTHLEPIAARVRRGHLARLVGHPAADCETQREYRTLSLSVAFEAFITLGGDPDQPDQFDWSQADRVVRTAQRHLQRQLQHRSTNYGDYRARSRRRTTRPERVEAFTAPDEGDLSEHLLQQLARTLTPREYWVITESVLHEIPLAELARHLVRTDPQYHNNYARAESLVHVTKWRALRKARRVVRP